MTGAEVSPTAAEVSAATEMAAAAEPSATVASSKSAGECGGADCKHTG
jgi:hypothetical protein